MSIVSNHFPEQLGQSPDNFQLEGGFVRQGRQVRPTCSAREAAEYAPGTVEWFVEYWLRNVRGGRFLSGPFALRRVAVEHAARLLGNAEYEHEVAKLTIVALRKGGAA